MKRLCSSLLLAAGLAALPHTWADAAPVWTYTETSGSWRGDWGKWKTDKGTITDGNWTFTITCEGGGDSWKVLEYVAGSGVLDMSAFERLVVSDDNRIFTRLYTDTCEGLTDANGVKFQDVVTKVVFPSFLGATKWNGSKMVPGRQPDWFNCNSVAKFPNVTEADFSLCAELSEVPSMFTANHPALTTLRLPAVVQTVKNSAFTAPNLKAIYWNGPVPATVDTSAWIAGQTNFVLQAYAASWAAACEDAHPLEAGNVGQLKSDYVGMESGHTRCVYVAFADEGGETPDEPEEPDEPDDPPPSGDEEADPAVTNLAVTLYAPYENAPETSFFLVRAAALKADAVLEAAHRPVITGIEEVDLDGTAYWGVCVSNLWRGMSYSLCWAPDLTTEPEDFLAVTNAPASAETQPDCDAATYCIIHSGGAVKMTDNRYADARTPSDPQPVYSAIVLALEGWKGPYDGEPHGAVVKSVDPTDAVVTWATGGSDEFSSVCPTLTDAGTLTVRARAEKAATDDTVWATAEATAEIEVSPAVNSWVVEPSLSATSWAVGDEKPTVNLGQAKFGTVSANYTRETLPTAAGSYEATFAVPSSGNWSNALSKSIPFTISEGEEEPPEEPEDPPSAPTWTFTSTGSLKGTITDGNWKFEVNNTNSGDTRWNLKTYLAGSGVLDMSTFEPWSGCSWMYMKSAPQSGEGVTVRFEDVVTKVVFPSFLGAQVWGGSSMVPGSQPDWFNCNSGDRFKNVREADFSRCKELIELPAMYTYNHPALRRIFLPAGFNKVNHATFTGKVLTEIYWKGPVPSVGATSAWKSGITNFVLRAKAESWAAACDPEHPLAEGTVGQLKSDLVGGNKVYVAFYDEGAVTPDEPEEPDQPGTDPENPNQPDDPPVTPENPTVMGITLVMAHIGAPQEPGTDPEDPQEPPEEPDDPPQPVEGDPCPGAGQTPWLFYSANGKNYISNEYWKAEVTANGTALTTTGALGDNRPEELKPLNLALPIRDASGKDYSLVAIGDNFCSSPYVSSVALPNSLTSVSSLDCPNAGGMIVIPENVTAVNGVASRNADLYQHGDKLTELAGFAFSGSHFRSATVASANLATIGPRVFQPSGDGGYGFPPVIDILSKKVTGISKDLFAFSWSASGVQPRFRFHCERPSDFGTAANPLNQTMMADWSGISVPLSCAASWSEIAKDPEAFKAGQGSSYFKRDHLSLSTYEEKTMRFVSIRVCNSLGADYCGAPLRFAVDDGATLAYDFAHCLQPCDRCSSGTLVKAADGSAVGSIAGTKLTVPNVTADLALKLTLNVEKRPLHKLAFRAVDPSGNVLKSKAFWLYAGFPKTALYERWFGDAMDNWRFKSAGSGVTWDGDTKTASVAAMPDADFNADIVFEVVPSTPVPSVTAAGLVEFAADAGATVRYTVDGSQPTAAVGTVYAAPFAVAERCFVKAVAVKDGVVSDVSTSFVAPPRQTARKYRTFSILGDSLSSYTGCVTPSDNLCWYPEKNCSDNSKFTSPANSWWYKFAEKFDIDMLRDNAYSGAPVSFMGWGDEQIGPIKTQRRKSLIGSYSQSFVKRADNVADPDLIIVAGLANDGYTGAAEGSPVYSGWVEPATGEDAFTCSAAIPALCQVFDTLKTRHPNAKIVFIKCVGTAQSNLKTVCDHYGVQLVDFNNHAIHWTDAMTTELAEKLVSELGGNTAD